jgi:hypothetical protein
MNHAGSMSGVEALGHLAGDLDRAPGFDHSMRGQIGMQIFARKVLHHEARPVGFGAKQLDHAHDIWVSDSLRDGEFARKSALGIFVCAHFQIDDFERKKSASFAITRLENPTHSPFAEATTKSESAGDHGLHHRHQDAR